MDFDCIHNQAKGTMECVWLGGVIRLVVDWRSEQAVVLVRGEVRRRFSIAQMKIDEFMRIEEQCQESAEQLKAFEGAA